MSKVSNKKRATTVISKTDPISLKSTSSIAPVVQTDSMSAEVGLNSEIFSSSTSSSKPQRVAQKKIFLNKATKHIADEIKRLPVRRVWPD